MKSLIKEKIINAVRDAGFEATVNFSLEEPPQKEMGDWATNVALMVSASEKSNPREIAEKIKLELLKISDFSKVEIAGPGFINLIVKDEFYFNELKNILLQKQNYGKSELGKGRKINVEYVSANPTGPLHIGNARSGPIGEAIANIFRFFGYEVETEFYINDMGVQIRRLGESLCYWYEKISNPEAKFPEGGYPAQYIEETSKIIQEKYADELSALDDQNKMINFFSEKGIEVLVDKIKSDLKLAGINIETWTKESDMLRSGKSNQVVESLKQKGFAKEKDGALWFARSDDPELEDKESVLVKSDDVHSLTYFANDLAYHLDKLNRGSEKLIDVWGANHFGHIPRIKSGLKALGISEDKLDIILYQYVRLKKSGEAVSMGKRLGNFVTLRQVIEAGVAPDAFKYFILSQNPNTPFDFDIELAADTSEKNPVFYIKYAHARICSIIAKAGETKCDFDQVDLSKLQDSREKILYKELVKFPELLSEIKSDFQIQSLPHFAHKIAGLFHDFYSHCQVLTEDKDLTEARLSLILATKYVLANSLNILGIEAPEKM